MDLHTQILELLDKAKQSKEYFDPTFLDDVINALIRSAGEDFVPDYLCTWAEKMWTR